MRIDFRGPARLDDALDVSVALRQCRHASLVIAQDIRCDGRLLLDAEVKVAALDAEGFRPRGIPETLYEELKSLDKAAKYQRRGVFLRPFATPPRLEPNTRRHSTTPFSDRLTATSVKPLPEEAAHPVTTLDR